MGHIVGDATDLETLLANGQRFDHPRTHLAGKQWQNFSSTHWMTERGRFLQKFPVKPGAIDFATLEQRPGVGIGIRGVNSSDEVPGKAASGLKAVEGLEGRTRENAA